MSPGRWLALSGAWADPCPSLGGVRALSQLRGPAAQGMLTGSPALPDSRSSFTVRLKREGKLACSSA
jgi:hypothetical protein